MKKYLIITLAALAVLFGCNKPAEEEATPEVKLEITDIADNCATIKASLEQGKFYGGKIILAEKLSNVTVDYTNDIKFLQYVRENAKDIEEMPVSETVKRLTFDQQYLTAVAVYDKDGRICSFKYEIWTAVGNPDGISDSNSAGELDDNEIN